MRTVEPLPPPCRHEPARTYGHSDIRIAPACPPPPAPCLDTSNRDRFRFGIQTDWIDAPIRPSWSGFVAELLVAVAALASWLPARRAAAVAPAEVLRS